MFGSIYSQHSLIQTLKGQKKMVEIANVQIIESCHKRSSRTSQKKKTQATAFLASFLSSLNESMVQFHRINIRRRLTACLFPHDFVLQRFN